MKKFRWTKKQQRINQVVKLLEVIVFVTFLGIGSITGHLWFLRPTKSSLEKRNLSEFPSFTLATFFNGEYFSNISTWYADTFPNRESLISMNNSLKTMYGVNMGAMVETNYRESDSSNTLNEDSSETSKDVNKGAIEEIQNKLIENLYVDNENHAAYSLYYFSQSGAEWYASNLNNLVEELDGITNVYSLLIPTNSAILMDQNIYSQTGADDQKEALDFYNSQLDPRIQQINVYDTLLEHNDEYIYFRTDHHWTSLGAYYAYQQFCDTKNESVKKKSDYQKYTFDGFTGTYCSKVEGLDQYPDKIIAYGPTSTNIMSYYDEDDNEQVTNVIADVSDWESTSLYSCFLSGDRSFAAIDNPEIEDGTSVLVIKDSYGNPFTSYLIDDYDITYFMDFRCAKYKVLEFCKENNVTDIIIENSLLVIGGDYTNQIFEELFK